MTPALAELANYPQWVAWRNEDRGGPKPTKAPISPRTGRHASVNTPRDWTDYETAKAFADEKQLSGVGFVLTAADDYTGIDLDKCRNPETGEIIEWVREIVALGETYAEISPSGTGLRLIAYGKVSKATKSDAAGVEIYGDRRYLTITGNRLPGAPDEICESPRTLELLSARVAAFAPTLASGWAGVRPIASAEKSPDDRSKDRFRRVNDAALANPEKWVPELFLEARPSANGGYRISSNALGRSLEEDLSIAPEGIKDFGVADMGDARDGKRTAIDLVMEYGGAPDAVAAGQWLAERLGVDFERGMEVSPEIDQVAEEMSRRAKAPMLVPAATNPTSRQDLLLAEWLKRKLPPRDFLLGNILCTTSRWLIYGETGVGKTLFAAEIAGAVAAGRAILNWDGRRPARVMYLDGELPAETFKERMQLIAERYGEGLDFYGYCRDVLSHSDMPALNTPRGKAWLNNEIERIKPDLIVFDSIMCLLTGSMSEEESWEPIKAQIRSLTAKRIAQIWLHHTGHDTTKGFGTKTREWEMDTVISLTKADSEGDAIALEFKKARLRTPANAAEFQSRNIRRGFDGWTDETQCVVDGKRPSEAANWKNRILKTYDQLAKTMDETTDEEGHSIRLVHWTAITDALRNGGYLELTEKGAISGKARTALHRAKAFLLETEVLQQNGDQLWRPFFIA